MITLYRVVKRIDGVLGGLTLQTFTLRSEAEQFIDNYPGDRNLLKVEVQVA